MKENAYERYITESSGWLHTGRSALVERLLGFFVSRHDLTPDILEIGAGVGQNVPALRKFGTVDVLEIDKKGLEVLRGRPDVREVIAQGIPCSLARTYDIICAFDVIEHLEDDCAALQWIAENLKPGELFLATVPAHQWFFTQHDVALGHYRRYTRKTFRNIIPQDFELLADSQLQHHAVSLGNRCAHGLGDEEPLRPGSPRKQTAGAQPGDAESPAPVHLHAGNPKYLSGNLSPLRSFLLRLHEKEALGVLHRTRPETSRTGHGRS